MTEEGDNLEVLRGNFNRYLFLPDASKVSSNFVEFPSSF